jgi:hypothetical protein
MSIEKTRQTGDIDEPTPQPIIELQQIVLGMFLIWDALGDDYIHRDKAEPMVISDWARKHKLGTQSALEALIAIKERFRDIPFAHYIHCRDFKNEGWADVLLFNPKDSQDVLDQIKSVLDSRPFKFNEH